MKLKLPSYTVPIELMEKLNERIMNNSEFVNAVVDGLVMEYCGELDNYVSNISTIIQDKENPPTATQLDEFVMSLPCLMYFTSEAQENLGIKEDIALAIQKETFNVAYETTDGTIKDKTAAGELASATETLVAIAYNRAYKKIKQRMEYSMEILQSIKKVITRRIAELEVTKVDPGRMS